MSERFPDRDNGQPGRGTIPGELPKKVRRADATCPPDAAVDASFDGNEGNQKARPSPPSRTAGDSAPATGCNDCSTRNPLAQEGCAAESLTGKPKNLFLQEIESLPETEALQQTSLSLRSAAGDTCADMPTTCSETAPFAWSETMTWSDTTHQKLDHETWRLWCELLERTSAPVDVERIVLRARAAVATHHARCADVASRHKVTERVARAGGWTRHARVAVFFSTVLLVVVFFTFGLLIRYLSDPARLVPSYRDHSIASSIDQGNSVIGNSVIGQSGAEYREETAPWNTLPADALRDEQQPDRYAQWEPWIDPVDRELVFLEETVVITNQESHYNRDTHHDAADISYVLQAIHEELLNDTL
jgi:hypothetical protein